MKLEDFGLVPCETKVINEGDTYGRLTVLAVGKVPGTRRYFVICECSCGSAPSKYRVDKVRSEHTTSCGCLQGGVTHGLSRHPLCSVWRHMIDRCYDPTNDRFQYYGARGIKVCDRWHKLESFVSDMGTGYRKGLQIERINNEGHYTPENCTWATRIEQARNRRSNIKLSHQGKTMTLAEWSEETGLPYSTLWDRVQYGWIAERILTTPAMDAKTRCAKARAARRIKSPLKSRT